MPSRTLGAVRDAVTSDLWYPMFSKRFTRFLSSIGFVNIYSIRRMRARRILLHKFPRFSIHFFVIFMRKRFSRWPINEATTINSKKWYCTIVRPRKCKRNEYISKGKKSALVTFSWPTYKLLHWSLLVRRCPIHLKFCTAQVLQPPYSISFGLSFLPT